MNVDLKQGGLAAGKKGKREVGKFSANQLHENEFLGNADTSSGRLSN